MTLPALAGLASGPNRRIARAFKGRLRGGSERGRRFGTSSERGRSYTARDPQGRRPTGFRLIDAVKGDYLRYFPEVEPKLAARAVVVADNVIKFAAVMRDFFAAIESDPKYQTVTIRASDEKGDGMAVICKGK